MAKHDVWLGAGVVFAMFAWSAEARPAQEGVRAFCAAHPNDPGPGDSGPTPREVRKAGATTFRCRRGAVLVCDGGATGFLCLKGDPVVTNDLIRDVAAFCRANPGDSPPDSVTASQSSWDCVGQNAVLREVEPVDADGYFKDKWQPLPPR